MFCFLMRVKWKDMRDKTAASEDCRGTMRCNEWIAGMPTRSYRV